MGRRKDKASTSSFARGSELWMHQFRLFLVAIRTVLLISVLVGLIVASAYFWFSSTEDLRYAWGQNLIATVRQELFMTAARMELSINGDLYRLRVSEVIALTEEAA